MRTTASKNLMKPQEYFSELQKPITPRSSFDRGNEILTTFNQGYLIPLFWDEVLPSDTWNVSQNLFARITTLIKPLMDNLYLDIHWFFVPNRIIWTHWPNFMGEQEDPANPITYTIPQITVNTAATNGVTWAAQTLGDYLGLPTLTNNLTFSALPIRAYYKCYDDYYRDENLIKERLPVSARGDATINLSEVSGVSSLPLLKRARRKDYFTSALPWAQKGTAPTISLGSTAPVVFPSDVTLRMQTVYRTSDNLYFGNIQNAGAGTKQILSQNAAAGGDPVQNMELRGVNTLPSNAYANLAAATGFTLNAFREFATIQQYLELDARGGTRYVEHLYTRFGVQPEDSRLQRAEYLGGQTFDLMVTPIAQTSESGAGTPQANLSGMGTFAASGHQFVKSFTEDGIIMAIGSVRQEQRYQQGMSKKWSRTSRYDYFDPIFANLGEQPILNKELYCQGTSADDDIFGYQEAWAEYRYNPSMITGMLRSNYAQSLDSWHLAIDYASLPTLSQAFVEEDAPMDRVMAVTDESDFILNGRFNINCARPLPTRSIPGLTRL